MYKISWLPARRRLSAGGEGITLQVCAFRENEGEGLAWKRRRKGRPPIGSDGWRPLDGWRAEEVGQGLEYLGYEEGIVYAEQVREAVGWVAGSIL